MKRFSIESILHEYGSMLPKSRIYFAHIFGGALRSGCLKIKLEVRVATFAGMAGKAGKAGKEYHFQSTLCQRLEFDILLIFSLIFCIWCHKFSSILENMALITHESE